MAMFMAENLPKYEKDDLPRTVKRLHDYAAALTEQLQFVLMHLDEDNLPGLDVLQKQVQDAAGNLSAVEQTADGLRIRVENAEGALSAVTQTAQGLETRVQSAEGGLSALTQTAQRMETRVQNAEGGVSALTQTAQGLESRVTGLDGKYSSLKQTVDGFDLTGMVTFRDLETDGASIISGNNITTGEIAISSDRVNGVYFYNGTPSPERMIGALEVYSQRYPDLFLESVNGNNIRVASAAQVSIEAGQGGHVYLAGDDYVQLRVAGKDYFFRGDGIYLGDQKLIPA